MPPLQQRGGLQAQGVPVRSLLHEVQEEVMHQGRGELHELSELSAFHRS